MLHSGAHARARPIDDALTRLEVLVAAPALLSKVLGRRSKRFDHFALPGIGTIAPDVRFSPVQQLGQQVAVAHVGGARRHRMDHLVNALAAWYLFGESLSAMRLAGIAFIVIGV